MHDDPAAEPPGGVRSVRHARRLEEAVRRLFGDADASIRRHVEAAAAISEIRGGEVLFREGDPGDAAYVVLAGRLRAVMGPAEEERVLSDAIPGETVGELALLTGSERSATVYAVRDSTVARIATADFDSLLARHPGAALPIMRLLADRLRRATAVGRRVGPTTTIVAVFGVGEDGSAAEALASAVAADLAVTLGDGGAALVHRDAVRALDGDALADELETREAASAVVVYAGQPGWTPWNALVLRRADEVLLVADALADPAPGAVDDAVFAPRERGGPRVTLVLRQPAGRYPSGTARWLSDRPVDAHLHIRDGDPADVARVGRWVTGRSVALVLGGGGARGWAHLGALRAMEELGIPVDLVGGTSHGALVGAAIADGHGSAEILEVARDYVANVKDYTPPVVSLLRGGLILRAIRRAARPGAGAEDLWRPYYAVATNLTRAEPLVIDRGPVDEAIRSSVSLPVILPPMVRDGDLVVDGGLLDNLPVGPMRSRMPAGSILAIDPSPRRSATHYDDLPPDASGWRLMGDRLRRRRRVIPSLGEIVQRTVLVGSMHLRRRDQDDPDLLVLAPDLGDWALLDFAALEVIAEAGYRELREPIRAWWAARGGEAPPGRDS